jgi:GTPase
MTNQFVINEFVIRIGLIGGVDSGKSTTLGVLTKLGENELDDGNGYARSKILRFPHEKLVGRTSSITKEHKNINNKIIEFIDLAGHKKYLKTTISGLTEHCIDYVILLIGANMGISDDTEEHLKIAIGLNIPIIIIITKIDIAPDNILKKTLININSLIKKYLGKKFIINIQNNNDNLKVIQQFKNKQFNKTIPLLLISNKTGKNINLLKNLLSQLPNKYIFINDTNHNKFWIHKTFVVKGIGLVFYGIVMSGIINKKDKMFIGPFNNQYKQIIIKSIHDDDCNDINQLSIGYTGCISIRTIDNKNPIKRKYIKKGIIITNQPKLYKQFTAKIYVYHHSTTISNGFEAMLHCGNIRQTVKFIDIKTKKKINNKHIENEKNNLSNNNLLRTRDIGIVQLEFKLHSEYLEKNMKLMIRDGSTVAMGKIIDL